jgi:CubicO group peptidase (beta-lactamase class C family)
MGCRILLGFLALLNLQLFCQTAIAQSQSNDALSAKVDELVRAHMSAERIPGVSLAVMRDGKIIKAAGYGLANVELKSPVTPQSAFRSRSMKVSQNIFPIRLRRGRTSQSDIC